jgi:nucleoid DNA-binding protein
MTKAQFVEALATNLGIPKPEAANIVESYTALALATLKAEGEITLPGLVKIVLKDKPAQPEKQKMNPFTKTMVTVKAKPASKKVVARPVGPLKKAIA